MAGRLGHCAVGCNLCIAQGDGVAALLNGQVALDSKETKHVELQGTAGLQEFALLAVHGEFEAGGCATCVGAGGDRQIRLACGIVHHQGVLRFGCDVFCRTCLLGGQACAVALGLVGKDQVRHVHAFERAAKADLQLFAAPEFDRGCGSKAAANGCIQAAHQSIELGLNLRFGVFAVDRLCAGGLGAVRQAQREADVSRRAIDHQALHFSGLRTTLGNVGGHHHRQAQVALWCAAAGVVGGDVGHIGGGQRIMEAEQIARLAAFCLAGIQADRDLVGPKQRIKCGLDVGLEGVVVRAVSDGTAVLACAVSFDVADLEVALGQLGVDVDAGKFQGGHVHALECATKAHGVGIDAACDGDRAQCAQAAVVGGLGSVQCVLYLGSCSAQCNVGRGVDLASVGQAQTQRAPGGAIAVDVDGLDFCHSGLAVRQQFVGHTGAGDADALVGNVNA